MDLVTAYTGQDVALVLIMLLMLALILGFIAGSSLILIWAERKVAARIQNRVGPMMTGPRKFAEFSMWTGGLLQTAADAIKLLVKELIIPSKTDAIPFIAAPVLIVTVCVTAYIVIPFGPAFSVSDLNIGVVHVVAISSLTVLSIVMAGWSSNSKYSLLGGLRSAAQMLSYEIPLIFALLGPILLAGGLSMQKMVLAQREYGCWFLLPSLLGFLIYYVASIAEVNRPPFDIPEAESELVAGYVSEYSGMMFAMFFLAEFANMFLVCSVAATVFLGGWLVPFMPVPDNPTPVYILLGILTFFLKTSFLVFIMMWIRWTFPRVRPDHLMNLGWKYLFPLSLLNLLICAGIAVLKDVYKLNGWGISLASLGALAMVMLLLQVVRIPRPDTFLEKA
ncbi:NADH-quinone oxidoreductase subunit NuoH [bacterium]|nr:NADH-quinone oxidoreductase subunit NuoH [bacterium]